MKCMVIILVLAMCTIFVEHKCHLDMQGLQTHDSLILCICMLSVVFPVYSLNCAGMKWNLYLFIIQPGCLKARVVSCQFVCNVDIFFLHVLLPLVPQCTLLVVYFKAFLKNLLKLAMHHKLYHLANTFTDEFQTRSVLILLHNEMSIVSYW